MRHVAVASGHFIGGSLDGSLDAQGNWSVQTLYLPGSCAGTAERRIEMSWLSDVFHKGGPFFIINTFFLAVCIALIVERSWVT